MKTQSQLALHIDELILKDIDPAHHERISPAIQRELARLIQRHGLPVGLQMKRRLHHLSGCKIEMSGNQSPESIGARIAQSLYQQLGRDGGALQTSAPENGVSARRHRQVVVAD